MQTQLKTWLLKLLACALLTAATSMPAMAAIAFVQEIGEGDLAAGGSTTSVSKFVTSEVTAGDVIVLEVMFSGSTNQLTLAVNDTGANGYTFLGGAGSIAEGTLQTYIAVAPVTTSLQPGDAITVSFTTSTPNGYNVKFAAQEFSGVSTDIDNSTPDVLNTAGTTTNFSTGTLVTTNANDLLLAYVAMGSDTPTGVTQTTSPTFTPAIPILDNGVFTTLFPAYSIVSTTGSYTFAGNFTVDTGSPPPFAVGIYALKAAVAATNPNLTVTKSHIGDFTQGQSMATYTLTVTNTGTAPTSGTLTIIDTLPTGLSFAGASSLGWSYAELGQTVTITTTIVIAPGASSVIHLHVNVAADAPALVTNTATIACNSPCTFGGPASDPTTITGTTPPPPPPTVAAPAPALSPFNLAVLILLFGGTALFTLRKIANRMRLIYRVVDRD